MNSSLIYKVINKFLVKEGIFKDSKDFLLKHSDYPKIKSIIDFFNSIKIENKVIKTSKNQLCKLDSNFFAITLNNGLVLVTKINNDKVKYYSLNGWGEESIDDFNKIWNGIILIAEKQSHKKKNYLVEKSLLLLKTNRLFLVFILFVSYILFLDLNIILTLLFILKSIGLILSLNLYKTSIDESFKQKFCSIGSKISCSDVLNSRGANIIKGFSLNDMSFFYFALGFVSLALSHTLKISPIFNILVYLSFLSLPIISYSIYYQWFIIKKWCSFCILIICILVAEMTFGSFVINKIDSSSLFEVNLFNIGYIAYPFVLSIILISFIKKMILKYFTHKNIYYKYHKLKYDKAVFNYLQNENKIIFNNLFKNELKIISKNSTNKITLIINPYCSICGLKLKKIQTLLETDSNLFELSILFTESINNEFSLYFLTLYEEINDFELLIALIKWFEIKDFKLFKAEYPIQKNPLKSLNLFEKQVKWISQNNITTTPLVLFNNVELSEYYEIEELKLLLK